MTDHPREAIRPSSSFPPPEWLPEARRLYEMGLSSEDVGQRVGRSGSVVVTWLRRAGVTIRRQGVPYGFRYPGVVHLLVVDPADPDYNPGHGRIFTACCGSNIAALITKDLVTARRELVTCPGRGNDHGRCTESYQERDGAAPGPGAGPGGGPRAA